MHLEPKGLLQQSISANFTYQNSYFKEKYSLSYTYIEHHYHTCYTTYVTNIAYKFLFTNTLPKSKIVALCYFFNCTQFSYYDFQNGCSHYKKQQLTCDN